MSNVEYHKSNFQNSLVLPDSCTSSLFKVAYIFIDYNLLPAAGVNSVAVDKQKRQKIPGQAGPQARQVQGPGLEWTRNEQGYRDIGTVSGRDGTGPRFRRKMSGRTLSDVDKIVEHAKVRLNYRKQLINEAMSTVAVLRAYTPYHIQNCSSQERTCCLSPKLSPLT